MVASFRIAFLIFLPLMSSFAQNICTDNRYEAGGFTLSSTDICHNENVTITNTAGVENPKYYYNYRGESYEEVMALGGTALDFSGVTKPGLYQVVQVGKKDGKETSSCREVKVRNSNTAVFSYTFCTVSGTNPTRIEVIIPSHPINDNFSSYQIELNGTVYNVTGTNISYPFTVQNVSNTLKVTGQGGSKTCSTPPLTTIVNPFNASGANYEYYPEIKELRVLEDKSITLDFRGQYEQTYSLFRYAGGQPAVGLTPIKTGLKASQQVTDTPPNPGQSYCYFIQPAIPSNCGLFSLRSADICSVPLVSPLPPTVTANYLQWFPYTGNPTLHQKTELLKINDGAAETPIPVNMVNTYQDNHGDCSKKNCYRIKVTYAGTVSAANFSGTSLSNQMCFDHRLELTDFPENAFVSTEAASNLVRFDANNLSSYNLAQWELHKFDGSGFALLKNIAADTQPLLIKDESQVVQSEKYKVRYVDECKNTSAFSPEISSIFLSEDNDNVLDWTSGLPFAETDIRQYEVMYYEGGNQNRLLGSHRESSTSYAHLVNAAAFSDMGTFVVKAISHDGRESFSNPVTISIKGTLYLSTAFSPNGDGINDIFDVKGNLAGIRTFHMAIFSASGQKIADITDPAQGWDGKLPNGQPALFGNYLFTLKAEMTNGHFIDKNGSFALIY